jgi:2,3-bisphosphoglycerate-dependent phosphoglycerate mutase
MFSNSHSDNTYYITLLRHGESIGNAKGYYQGQTDYPLNKTGKAQAQALAERWLGEGKHFNLVITSTLSRAKQTAEILCNALALPMEEEPLWMERDNGLLAGLRPEEAAQNHPRPAFMTPYHHIGESGESQWELYLRAGKAIQKLLDRPPAKYLVVSHGGILNMAMYVLLGITPQANFHGPRFRFKNTAFASLNYLSDNHIWRLEGLNDRQHW